MAADLTATGVVQDSVRTTAMAWGRIENNSITGHANISAISTTGAGAATRDYTLTMSPTMANDDYAVVTTGYAHEGGAVEGLVQWYSYINGGYTTTSQFRIKYTGNGTPDCDCIGFAVFGT